MKETWRSLNRKINQLTEDEVLTLLDEERRVYRRSAVLERLHQRYCNLRAARERIEIMQEAQRP